jgi:hypothetical protein
MIMKKICLTTAFFSLMMLAHSQIDTISQNLYQFDGRIGIGQVNSGGYFNPGLSVYNRWIQISDSTNHDAGLVISHLHRNGYGFARTLHMVFEGVSGDPYTEFRVRRSSDHYTVTSWAIGACNSDEDKLIISNAIETSTGASPSIGERIMTMRTTGEVGIGTSDPCARLEIADGDVYISDIERGIIMKSPDGQCWRGTLDDSGILRFNPIDCPGLWTTILQPVKSREDIMIYPNPTDNNIIIGINERSLKGLNYHVYDLSGKLLNNGQVKSNFETLDFTSFQPGTYLVTVSDKTGNVLTSGKIIKK